MNEKTQEQKAWGQANTAAVSIPCQLRFDGVCHTYDNHCVLHDVSLVADPGTITCLVGPSGSGKTSLLRIAAGMMRQTHGEIYLDELKVSGEDVFVPPEKRGIGLVFQDYALFEHLTLLENVAFGLIHIKRRERNMVARQMLRRVGLLEREKDFPHDLSGGEQQRVALARALAPRPGVLLMDEPFSGLDARLRDSMREETWGILRETRATSLIVTHDPEEALMMGEKIALLCDGKLEQFGTPNDLFLQPKSLFAASFFSAVNVFSAQVKGGRVSTPLGEFEANKFEDGRKVRVVVRTNALGVQGCKGHDGGSGSVRGRIIDARFIGDYYQIKLGVEGVEEPLQGRVVCISQEGSEALSGGQV